MKKIFTYILLLISSLSIAQDEIDKSVPLAYSDDDLNAATVIPSVKRGSELVWRYDIQELQYFDRPLATWTPLRYPNIYTHDGTFTANRTGDLDGKFLQINDGTDNYLFLGGSFNQFKSKVDINGNSSRIQMFPAGANINATNNMVRLFAGSTVPAVTNPTQIQDRYSGVEWTMFGDIRTYGFMVDDGKKSYIRALDYELPTTGNLILKQGVDGEIRYSPYDMPAVSGAEGEALIFDANGDLVAGDVSTSIADRSKWSVTGGGGLDTLEPVQPVISSLILRADQIHLEGKPVDIDGDIGTDGQVMVANADGTVDWESAGHLIYIAASDTPPEVSQIAKYKCSGVSDRDTIIKAINELGARGGTIHLLAGTYSVHTLPLRDGLFYQGAGSNQQHTQYGTTLNMDGSTGEKDLFHLEGNVAVFNNGGIKNMNLIGSSASSDIAVNLREDGKKSSRMENFEFSGNFLQNWKYAWLGGSKERAPQIHNNFFRGCKVAIYCGEHPRIHNNDIRSCVFGIVNPFDALIFDNKLLNGTVGIGDFNKLNGKGYLTQTATVTATTVNSAGTFVNAGRDTYVVFFDSGNAYRITAKNSDDEVVVDGDPSAESGEIAVTGFGVGSNNISDGIYGDYTCADVILAGDNQYSDNRHIVNISDDVSIGLFVRGNNNFIKMKVEPQGTKGFVRGAIELSSTSFTSAYQVGNVITSSFLTNPVGDLIKIGGNGRQYGLVVTNNRMICSQKAMTTSTAGFMTRCVFNGNTFKLNLNNSESYILGIRDVGSSESNCFINNAIDNGDANTVAAILDGEWNRSTVTGTHFTETGIDLFTATAVIAGANLTSIPTDDPTGARTPNTNLFYGTDGNLYFKDGAGVVTQK